LIELEPRKEPKPMDPLIIPIVALLIPIVIVPTALGIKHARFLREVEHAERMRAMELGQTLPGDVSWTPASVAVLIGAGVPIAAMLIAFMAGRSFHDGEQIRGIWQAAAVIGFGGVICGTALGIQQFAKTDRPAPVSHDEKLAFDPDAYDVVGRRG
jgi:drug/metabolite transporter (DMT)-like permease